MIEINSACAGYVLQCMESDTERARLLQEFSNLKNTNATLVGFLDHLAFQGLLIFPIWKMEKLFMENLKLTEETREEMHKILSNFIILSSVAMYNLIRVQIESNELSE